MRKHQSPSAVVLSVHTEEAGRVVRAREIVLIFSDLYKYAILLQEVRDEEEFEAKQREGSQDRKEQRL